MPKLYLSPSTQEYNRYLNGTSEDNEEFYMNLVADLMIPYLKASGIEYVRNDRDTSAAQAIRDSNAGNYDLHLALHSNAAPENLAGKLRGIDAYYYPGSAKGKRAAEIFADNLKKIYPLPDKVQPRITYSLGEVTRTRAPAVLLELGYHDNEQDEQWIIHNLKPIAKNIAQSVAKYFNVPFVEPK